MNKMAKRLIAIILVLSMACALGACAPAPAATAAPEAPAPAAQAPAEGNVEGKVEDTVSDAVEETASAYAINPADTTVGVIVQKLGDKSLSDMTYNGVLSAKEKYGFQMDYTECGENDMALVLEDYLASKEYDLLVIMSYHVFDEANAALETYPDQKFVVFDYAAEGNPNMVAQQFCKNEIGFMAGVFTAMLEEKGEFTLGGTKYTWEPTGKFGAMIGVEVPTTVDTITGFYAGVRYIKPEAEIVYTTVGGWADQTKAKELAQTMIDSGCNFMFHNAGGSFLGALEAYKEAGKFCVVYDDTLYLDTTTILAASARDGVAVFDRFFNDYFNGTWNGGTTEKNGFFNGCEKFMYQDGMEVPEDIQKVMDEVLVKIQAGEIAAPSTWDELDAFNMTYAG